MYAIRSYYGFEIGLPAFPVVVFQAGSHRNQKNATLFAVGGNVGVGYTGEASVEERVVGPGGFLVDGSGMGLKRGVEEKSVMRYPLQFFGEAYVIE